MTESKVDLLAFFDVLQGLPSMVTTMRGETFTSFDVRKARAVVAELIEAAREVEADAATLGMATTRLSAALAACTPAKEGGR